MRNIKIHRIPLGSYETNCYLLENIDTKNALIIDCGNGEEFQEYVDANKLDIKIKYGLLTHGHFDHVMGVEYIQNNYGTVFFMSLEDLKAQQEEPYLFPRLRNVNVLYHGLELNLDDFKATVISTPGHTMGSLTFKIENHLFTGDTLFKNNVGRTELYGGNFEDLIKSIKEKIFTFPKETIIYPGHGEESTIENEMNNNEILKQ